MKKLSHIPLKLDVHSSYYSINRMEHELYMGKIVPYNTEISGIWDNFSIYNECSILFMINITSAHLILVVYVTTFPYTTIFYIYNYFSHI